MSTTAQVPSPKEMQLESWTGVAPGWKKHDANFTKSRAAASEKMLDAAGVALGMRVLDIATGVGEPALAAARRVGPGGFLTPTISDLSNALGRAVTPKCTKRRRPSDSTTNCLDHVIVRDELHAERALGAYLGYYHGRPHRSLRMQPPDAGRHLAPRRPTRGTRIATKPILGGLHLRYGFVPVGLAPTSNEAVA